MIRTHLLDIITTAEETHYENFRDKQLEKGGLGAGMTPEKLDFFFLFPFFFFFFF